jgi:hypothetical protein
VAASGHRSTAAGRTPACSIFTAKPAVLVHAGFELLLVDELKTIFGANGN